MSGCWLRGGQWEGEKPPEPAAAREIWGKLLFLVGVGPPRVKVPLDVAIPVLPLIPTLPGAEGWTKRGPWPREHVMGIEEKNSR